MMPNPTTCGFHSTFSHENLTTLTPASLYRIIKRAPVVINSSYNAEVEHIEQ